MRREPAEAGGAARRLPRVPRELGLPAATGLLLAVAFPPLHLVVPPFVALVPLAVHIDRAGRRGVRSSPGARPPRPGRRGGPAALAIGPAARAGAVAGGVAWGLLLAWIVPALLPWSWLAVPLYLAAVAVLAGVTGAVGAALHVLRARAAVPLALAVPLAWTAGEWLRAHLPGSLAFPWLGLGTSLTGRPEWLGIAEVVGTRGVTFWLAAVSGLLAWGWRRREEAGRRNAAAALPVAAAVALAVAVPVWGVFRAGGLETRPVARVAVVQPGVTRRTHPDPDAMRSAVRAALDRLAPRVAAAGPDLVVLPEAVLPDTLPYGAEGPDPGEAAGEAGAEAWLADLSRRTGAPVVAGMLTRTAGPGGPVVRNSVVLVDGGGLRPWRYDKRHLVPMVERVPLLPLPGLAPGSAGYGPGRTWSVARLGPSLDVGAFVCYESAFAGVSRALVAAGADLLVNVTNDGWFGGHDARTHALWQHPAHLVLRAVETRTGIARAASTGVSLFVDPTGRVEGRTELSGEAVSMGTVRAAEGPTLFVRWGDVTGAGSAAVTALLVLAAWARRARHIGGRQG